MSECATGQARDRAAALIGLPLAHAALDDVLASCAPPSGLAAENLSRAAATPPEVVAAWLGSPGHANNLLSPQLAAIGTACVQDAAADPPGMLCSQVFLG